MGTLRYRPNLPDATTLPLIVAAMSAAFASPPSAQSQDSRIAPVITIVAAQDSEGLTEADLTPAILQRLETWSVNTSRRKMSESLARAGQDPNLAYRVKISSQ